MDWAPAFAGELVPDRGCGMAAGKAVGRIGRSPVRRPHSLFVRRAIGAFRPYSERPITSFMISFVPPKIRVTRAARQARAIGYSFI